MISDTTWQNHAPVVGFIASSHSCTSYQHLIPSRQQVHGLNELVRNRLTARASSSTRLPNIPCLGASAQLISRSFKGTLMGT